MNRRSITILFSSLCLFAPACLSLSTTDPSGNSASSGAGGAGGESASSSSGKTSSSASSGQASSSSSGAGGAGGGPTVPLPGWGFRRPLVISPQSETLTQFILLVHVVSDNKFGSNVQPDGDDLVFTDANGTTKLSYELESFTQANGVTSFLAWVKVPQVPAAGKTIYLYYGNPSVTSQQNLTGTWQNYDAVYHLENDFKDSSSNAYDGTVKAPIGAPPSPVVAKIGRGHEFPGGSYAEVPHSNDFNCLTSNCTASMWIYSAGQTSHVIDHYINAGNGSGWFLGTADGMMNFTHGGTQPILFGAPMTTNEWHHVALSKEFSKATMYIDGVQVQSKGFISGLATATAPLYIGTGNPDALYFVGKLDEFRIAKVDRSAAWILADVKNTLDPASFYSLGDPEKF